MAEPSLSDRFTEMFEVKQRLFGKKDISSSLKPRKGLSMLSAISTSSGSMINSEVIWVAWLDPNNSVCCLFCCLC